MSPSIGKTIKKLIETSIIFFLLMFLVGIASNSFASSNMLKNDPGCENSFGVNRVNAQENFDLGECKEEIDPSSSPDEESPEEDDDSPCSDPDRFNSDPTCWSF